MAWEIRTAAQWKHCLGQKGMSIFKGESNRLVLFEGMMDYLSWATKNPQDKSSVFVLNSIALIDYAIKAAVDFKDKTCFFDNDEPGRKAAASFLAVYPDAANGASAYQGYEDYNAMLMDEPQPRMPWEEEGVFQKVLNTYKR
ncbi:hypothetical protein DU508_21600 [Pedobacter chinensis]|uniref:Toprim domain-containing protein n=1 Tax=Pedobacter chinensis TaxID=2282421 RepID=A0A369PUC2_9SPHI|nr:toprim domain-containing protein [Pedobacter chinensis]RDC54319.1 hypothetical protein DU508_21600 [Pedobacter chinensis]